MCLSGRRGGGGRLLREEKDRGEIMHSVGRWMSPLRERVGEVGGDGPAPTARRSAVCGLRAEALSIASRFGSLPVHGCLSLSTVSRLVRRFRLRPFSSVASPRPSGPWSGPAARPSLARSAGRRWLGPAIRAARLGPAGALAAARSSPRVGFARLREDKASGSARGPENRAWKVREGLKTRPQRT